MDTVLTPSSEHAAQDMLLQTLGSPWELRSGPLPSNPVNGKKGTGSS